RHTRSDRDWSSDVCSSDLAYLRFTGRQSEQIALVEAYCKEQGLFRTDETPAPLFNDTLELDLGSVESAVAGPKRPQDRVPLRLRSEERRVGKEGRSWR